MHLSKFSFLAIFLVLLASPIMAAPVEGDITKVAAQSRDASVQNDEIQMINLEKKAYFGSHSSGSSGSRSSSSGSRSSTTYFGSSSSHHNGSKSTQASKVLGFALLVGLSTTAASLWMSF